MGPGSFVNLAAAFLLAAALPSSTAVAQAKYPDRPIRIVVGFAAGGPTDVMARKLAAKIGPILGQSVVVDNKPGASATIAIADVAKSKPDGYTLYFGDSGAFAITALTLPNLPYDVTRDFDPVAMFAAEQLSFAVNPTVPANNLRELAALIKANPGKYSFGHSGTGNIGHLTGEMFKLQAGNLDLAHVAYKGAGPAVNDALAGHIPIIVGGLGSVYPYQQSGKLRVLATAAEKRASFAPDIPTAIESGYPDLVSTATQTLIAPAGTPPAVIDTLAKAVAQAMAEEAFLNELRQASAEPVAGSTPARAREFLASEYAKWAKVVKSTGIKLQ
jgi:tripartite-type tricarboxylate transporter receptor subunit TctC